MEILDCCTKTWGWYGVVRDFSSPIKDGEALGLGPLSSSLRLPRLELRLCKRCEVFQRMIKYGGEDIWNKLPKVFELRETWERL